MADKTITNPAGAFGYTDLKTKLWSLEAPFVASAAITAPVVVSIGTDGSVATTATDGASTLAEESISSGGTGGVVVHGIAENVTADGAITAGAILKRSATTAGAVAATATPAAGEAIGVAINASSGNTVDVWVGVHALS
jgi:hypothetical protein